MLYGTENHMSVLIGIDINLMVFAPSMKMMEFEIVQFFPGIFSM